MKILYISQYYPPEIGAGGFRAEAIVSGLAFRGHKLTVITEIPNYPLGELYNGYRNALWQTEKQHNIIIHRVWVQIAKKMNFVRRLVFYFSYTIMALLKGILLGAKYDVVYATSPPLFVGIAGYILSKFYRIPLVFEVRDLWPAIAIESGEIKSRAAIRLSKWLERFLYSKSKFIVTVTNGFKKRIMQNGILPNKIEVVYNFSKSSNQNTEKQLPSNIRSLFSDNKFIVLYAGLIGLFQGVNVIIDAAKLLREQKELLFLIIGKGTEEPSLKILAEQMNLNNIIWMPPQPSSLIHILLSKAGCSIIPLKDLPSLRMTIPSKLFDYMGCGCPIILSANGEVRDILKMADAGISVEPENPQQLAKAIMYLYENREIREKFTRNGIDAVRRYFSSENAIRTIELILQKAHNIP